MWHEGLSGPQASVSGRRIETSEMSGLLARTPFLEGLEPEVLAEVAAACELVQIAGEQQLLSRDLPGDSLYVVVYGGLRTVGRDSLGRERVVSESFRGDSVGLLNLLPDHGALMDVFAIRDSLLLRLTRARFLELGARYPRFVMRLAQALARRATALLGHQPQWTTWSRPGAAAHNIALVVPGGDPSFARAAADLAAAALDSIRRVARVTRLSLDQALGQGVSSVAPSGLGNERALAYFQELEAKHDVLLYECDTTSAAWNERGLRQADRILVLLRADHGEHARDVRPWLERVLGRRQVPRIDLALVHPGRAEVPSRSAQDWNWLPESAHLHHVRMGDDGDYRRLARTLLRAGVAVVLSGGGACGIAHVGMLKALEEARVPVDAIAGTSMGAIMAAGYACGWSADALMARVRELFRHRMALYDPTFPSEALLAGRKLEQVLRRYFEGLDIRDLWLPFFCVSTNLTRSEARVHDRGELWRAVAASCSIPGIFPPRQEDGELLVDGGLMNNLPVDVMAERFGGAIIASDVTANGKSARPRSADGPLRRWLRQLRGHTQPATRGPGIFELLTQSTMVASRHAALASLASGYAALHLRLPVAGFTMLDWSAYDDLYTVGYEYTRQQLASWRPPNGSGEPG